MGMQPTQQYWQPIGVQEDKHPVQLVLHGKQNEFPLVGTKGPEPQLPPFAILVAHSGWHNPNVDLIPHLRLDNNVLPVVLQGVSNPSAVDPAAPIADNGDMHKVCLVDIGMLAPDRMPAVFANVVNG